MPSKQFVGFMLRTGGVIITALRNNDTIINAVIAPTIHRLMCVQCMRGVSHLRNGNDTWHVDDIPKNIN